MSVFTDWKSQVMGTPIDVDGAYGDQCVDVAMSYAQACFPGHQWPELLGYGNAKDLFSASNDAFFEKIANNHDDPNQLPNQGDIIVYDQTSTNPYGHIAIVDAADSGGVNEVEQNGFNPTGSVYEIYRRWGRSPCIGWLRPKDLSPPPAPDPVPEPAPEPAPAPTPDPVPAPDPTPVVDPPTPPPVDSPAEPPTPVEVPTNPEGQGTPVVTPKPSLLEIIIAWLIKVFTGGK